MASLEAFAIILDDRGRVLLGHRADFDCWNLPGGGVEAGESPWQACQRECLEEVGVGVAVERLVGVYHKPDADEVVFTFACRIVEGAVGTSDEVTEARWFEASALPHDLSPRQRERIEDALGADDRVVLRVQDSPGTRELVDRGVFGRAEE